MTQRPVFWGTGFGLLLLIAVVARLALGPDTAADEIPVVETAVAPPPRVVPQTNEEEKNAAKQWAALAIPTTTDIQVPPRTEGSERLQKLARKMDAPGASLVEPCLEWVGADCVHGSMDIFFQSLLDIERGDAQKHATVATLGNSLIASDHITDIVRERLSERFGSGGRGMVLADRISTYGRRTRSGVARTGHWRPHNFAMGDRGRYPFGVSGVLHASTRKGAKTRWHIDGERSADILFWDHPKAAGFRLRIDGEEVKRVTSKRKNRGRRIRVEIPEGAKHLDLVAEGREMVSYGANLEKEKPGVIWNTFGIPAAGAATFFESDEKLFRSQLKLQKPSLVVVMLGGNETKRIQWGKRKKELIEQDFRALLERVRTEAPDSSCLAIGPIDAVSGKPPNRFRTRPPLGWVINMQQRIAREKGCTYFNLFEAMGGAGSLERFAKQRMLHDDLVHPKRKGLDLLGELIASALFEGYDAYARKQVPAIRERRTQIATDHVEVPPESRSLRAPKLGRLAQALAAAAAPTYPPPGETFTIGWFMEEERNGAAIVHGFEARMAKRLAFSRPLADPVEVKPLTSKSELLEAWETRELASLVSFDAQATLDALRAKQYDMLLVLPSQTSLQARSPNLGQALKRLQQGSPEADCVLIAPLYPATNVKSLRARDDGSPNDGDHQDSVAETASVDELGRTLAEETSCGHLSLVDAIGGSEGFALWQQKGWITPSGLPTEAGAAPLSELLVWEMLDAAAESQRARLAQGASP